MCRSLLGYGVFITCNLKHSTLKRVIMKLKYEIWSYEIKVSEKGSDFGKVLQKRLANLNCVRIWGVLHETLNQIEFWEWAFGRF